MTTYKGQKPPSGFTRDRTIQITRDPKTGTYAIQDAKRQGVPKTSEHATPERPDAFIKRFTNHPVVDRVMKRLSR